MTSRYWKRCYESLKNEQFEFFVSDRFDKLFFLFHSEKKRETCECVCVCVCVFEKKMQMKNVVFEKNSFFVQFKDFCFLKSIFELIIRSFVNIKRKEKNLLRWQKIQIFFYSILSQFQLLFFSLCEFFWNLFSLFRRFASSKWSLLTFFFLSRIMFMTRRWSLKHEKKWSKSRDIVFKESLRTTWLKDKVW